VFYATALDITAAHSASQLFPRLLDSAPDAMVITKGDGTIHLVNRLGEQLFLRNAEDLIGQPIELLIPKRLWGIHESHRRSYRDNPRIRPMGAGRELTAVRADGVEFPAEISLGPLDTGEETFIVCAIRDITARRQAQEALRLSEERFELAVRGTEAGIWDWDLRTNLMYFSPQWKTMFGYDENEITSEHTEWMNRVHPEDQDRTQETLQRCLRGKTSEFDVEHRVRHKSGSYRWVMARGVTVRDDAGRPRRMVGSHIDITDLKITEERLNDQQAEFLAAEKIQTHLHPEAPPDLPGYDIAARTLAAEFVAGDMHDFFSMGDGSMCVVVGDVTGHGFSAALLMASTHAYLRALVEFHPDLCDLVTRVHTALRRELAPGRFVSALLARLDFRNHTLTCVNAGHPSGYVLDRGGSILASLDSTTWPLAVLPEIRPVEVGPIRLQEGQLALLMTDGVLEARSPTGEDFGLERVLEVAREHQCASAAQILDALYLAIHEFTGRERPEDDVTVVLVKRADESR
jgi:PAS domain S-box-containing protein